MNVYYKETQGWTEQRRLWDGVWARAEGQGTDRGLPVSGAKLPWLLLSPEPEEKPPSSGSWRRKDGNGGLRFS